MYVCMYVYKISKLFMTSSSSFKKSQKTTQFISQDAFPFLTKSFSTVSRYLFSEYFKTYCLSGIRNKNSSSEDIIRD